MIHTVKGFGVVNETEEDIFLKFPSFLYDPANVDNLLSGFSSFSKPSLDIWKFLVHIMLKPNIQGFKHDFTSMGDVDVFLEFHSFPYDPANVGNLISGSSSFSKPNLDIWNVLVCLMLKLSMEDFKHDLASMGDECNCPMVSTFFGTPLLGNWDED